MRKYANFAEMNMNDTYDYYKAQLLSFDSLNMSYSSSKFFNSNLLKNFTLIKALFFLINRFCLSCVVFFLSVTF